MRKIIAVFVAMFVVLLFMGCPLPVVQPDPSPSPTVDPTPSPVVIHTLIVKDSLWRTTKTVEVVESASSSRTLADDQAALNAEIAAYNALTNTDLLRIYLDTAPSIEDAPTANVFICNPDTNIPNSSQIGIPRQQLIDNWDFYLRDAFGQALYIDHIPPAPILAKDTTPYQWWAMYVIEDAPNPGTILYEDHAGYYADQSFHGEWITTPEGQTAPDGTPGGGWATLETYYSQMLSTYNTMCGSPVDNWPGVTRVHLVTREVYPPLPVAIIE